MPEIAEITRVVHFIKKHLVGRTIASATALEDEKIFGAVGTTGAAFQAALKGKTIVNAGQQGKYFWIELSSPPHPVLHFGMTGWFHLRGINTYYYREKDDEPKEWPPRFWKFHFETEPKGKEGKIEAAFVDARRFARVRLVDCKGSEIRKVTPLKENGPDTVVDKEIVTREWVENLCASKKVPIKAMLLDQANISGIGNWVGDEVLYYAKIHPEQYSNSLNKDQITKLHDSIHHICSTACGLLGESDKFPESWLFKHRWGKGKKDDPKRLPNGEKIVFLTVGGRTSAVVPSIQKKTGPVAKEIDDVDEEKPAKPAKNESKTPDKSTKANGIKTESDETSSTKKRKAEAKHLTTPKKSKTQPTKKEPAPASNGRRRSHRLSGK